MLTLEISAKFNEMNYEKFLDYKFKRNFKISKTPVKKYKIYFLTIHFLNFYDFFKHVRISTLIRKEK